MKCLVCLLEEPSAEMMLNEVLPKILPQDKYYHQCMVFEGKQDLEKRMEKRIRLWQVPESLFLVVRDQDSGDCKEVKTGLQERALRAASSDKVLVRIACHELESFYLGDLEAVEKGLCLTGLSRQQNNSKFRNPDALGNPAEEISKLTKKSYQKVAGSKVIAPYLKLDGSNTSTSFNHLISGITKKIQD